MFLEMLNIIYVVMKDATQPVLLATRDSKPSKGSVCP